MALGQAHFTLSQLTRETGLSTKAAREQLIHLRGQVTRVSPRQEFFVIVSPEQRLMGAPPVYWWLDAFFRERNRPYYVGLLSAAAEHGSSHQAVQAVQVVTDRPMRELVIGRQRIQFFVRKQILRVSTMQLEQAHSPLLISTPEATALDLIRYAYRIGGMGRAAEVISGLLGRFRMGAFSVALQAETETSNVQRLGYVLDKLARPDLCRVVAKRLPDKLSVVSLEKHKPPLSSAPPAISSQWSVLINTHLKDDKS